MSDSNERGGPPAGTASEDDLAAAMQLDLDTTHGTATSPTRPPTDPDPSARRRNLEQGRRSAGAPREVADAGAAAVLANTPVGSRDLAERCLQALIDSGRDWTAEDHRDLMDGHILGAHPNAISAVIRIAAKDGRIRCVGVTTATRPEARGRLIRVWRGTEVAR